LEIVAVEDSDVGLITYLGILTNLNQST
jgi:hypothetical protein